MHIANYSIKEKLHQGKNFNLYRAVHKDGTSYILKVLEKKTASDHNVITTLQHEYDFLRQINVVSVIKAIDWVEDKDHAVLVLEDIHGMPIKDFINKKWFSIDEFINLAVSITDALAVIHSHDIIHQDINPSNIIWNSKNNQIQIIDFNISSKHDIKISYMGNPERLRGTLPYISPEQTGRMNRRVDQRTDFYSLGATFYEMLTGKRPFPHHEPMEIVYAHLAVTPELPNKINEYIPSIISDIIMKLLAKNPEERYQSAVGLKYDLENLKKIRDADKYYPEDYVLGAKDFSGKLHIPEKLYGRKAEIEQLLAGYNRVSAGGKEMIMVTGYSGVGKTALVNEIHKPITKDHGYFVTGKFDQLQRNVPYYAFVQALNQFCELVLTEEQEILSKWKEHILAAVGDLGKVFVNIAPQMELIIGKQPDIPEVSGEEARQRLSYVFKQFIQVISVMKLPLVVFIDDLQWADPASLSLMQIIMEDAQSNYLFFIGAYRDNEVDPAHPLITAIENISANHVDVKSIPIKNLSMENIHEWLYDSLKAGKNKEVKNIDSLAELIYKKTQGNPFFSVQFLNSLFENKLLVFNYEKSCWEWDIASIEKENITDNVVDLLSQKIRKLSDEMLEIITLAACIGNVFDLETLSVISEKDQSEYKVHLESAIGEQLIYHQERDRYKFMHDRIHQAAYSLTNEQDKMFLHLKIGRLLLKNAGIKESDDFPDEAFKSLFEIVNHLNIGINLIDDTAEKIRLIRLNVQAANNAKKSAAYDLGANYVQTAIGLLPDDCWQSMYDLALVTYNEAVYSAYLRHDFTLMEEYINCILNTASTISDKAIAYECRVMGLTAQSKEKEAAETLLEIFSIIGIDIPSAPTPEEVGAALGGAQQRLEEQGVESLIDLPEMTDPDVKLALRLYYIGSSAIAFGAPELLPIVVSKIINLILDYGFAPEVPFILIWYGGMLRVVAGDFTGAYKLGKVSLGLLDKLEGHEALKARATFIASSYQLGYKDHYKDACELLISQYPYALNVGDFEYASYVLTTYVQFLCDTDIELSKFKKLGNKLLDQIVKLNMGQSLIYVMTAVQMIYVATLLGETAKTDQLDLSQIAEIAESLPDSVKIFYYYKVNIKNLLLKYMFESYDSLALDIKAVVDAWNANPLRTTYEQGFFLFYVPLAYIQAYMLTENDEEKKTYIETVTKSLEVLEGLAEFGPDNFLHKYYLLKAEYHRVTANDEEGCNKYVIAEYYDKAVESAIENDHIHEAGLAYELAGKFYISSNREQLAEFYLKHAVKCYAKWGAKTKIKYLKDKYPKYLSRMSVDKGVSDITMSISSTSATTDFIDVGSIIKASQTLSREVQLKNLLIKMMHILIENAGAQKSILIENTGKALVVQARGDIAGVSDVLQAVPIEQSDDVPVSVINYVNRSKRQLVFDNISNDNNYSTDEYIKKHTPKSVVCFPILGKRELSFILYLENSLIEGAFTPARLEVLNMLSAQIAISIENTHLYEHLEDKVRQRTTELRQMHDELEKKHNELAESHKKINDSVNYASRIQNAVLPGQITLDEVIPQHFVIYRPCSIISGDFYWIKKIDDKIIAAAADCTGHGIPGALLSMLGMSFLNEVVLQLANQNQLSAGMILDELRTRIKVALKQEGKAEEQKDGMDISLCIIEPAMKKIQYSGAFNPLYIIQDNELIDVAADNMPIRIYRKEESFSNHVISYKDGASIYLFSDGFIHQNSKTKPGVFSKKRLKEILLEINGESMMKQRDILIERFEAWKGDATQRDDVLILGIRL